MHALLVELPAVIAFSLFGLCLFLFRSDFAGSFLGSVFSWVWLFSGFFEKISL